MTFQSLKVPDIFHNHWRFMCNDILYMCYATMCYM